ncbi:MAG: type II toxin-antitoxin system VapC family toxin [Chlorobium sp.]|nr:type II toxin-antitoxin system VapC family toxin [Chlorobium sp.]
MFIFSYDAEIFDLAARLRGVRGLKLKDALHAATALRNGCSAIMTNDNGIRSVGRYRCFITLQGIG